MSKFFLIFVKNLTIYEKYRKRKERMDWYIPN